MDPVEYEQLSRESVRRITEELKKKEQFAEAAQIERALLIEEEVYKRSNKCCGYPETHNVWEDAKSLDYYRSFLDEMILNISLEDGPYWRRVEGGQIAPQHIFNKFCKSAASIVIPARVKKSPSKAGPVRLSLSPYAVELLRLWVGVRSNRWS